MNNFVNVTIIDSGIDTTFSDLSQFVGKSTGYRINSEGYIQEDRNMQIRHIHGTVVGLIIRELCKNIKIESINILNCSLSCDGRILLYAIKNALKRKPDILHLSLGTTSLRYFLPLWILMKKAKIQGTTVVAAAENEGKRSFPAYLKDVIGVKADSSLKNKFDYYYKSGFMFAPCELASIKGKNELKKEIGGNSTAAAYISGHLARKYYYSIKKKQK